LNLKHYFDIIGLPHYGRKGVDHVEKTFKPALLLKRFVCVVLHRRCWQHRSSPYAIWGKI